MLEDYLKKNWRSTLFCAAILWAVFIFPTPYRHYSDNQGNSYRRNRLNGKIESWYGTLGGYKTCNTENYLAAQKIRKQQEAEAKLDSSDKKAK
jgi:hypothetical protein